MRKRQSHSIPSPAHTDPAIKEKLLATAVAALEGPSATYRYDDFGRYVAGTLREIASNHRFDADMATLDAQRTLISYLCKTPATSQLAAPFTQLPLPQTVAGSSMFRSTAAGCSRAPSPDDYQLTTLTAVPASITPPFPGVALLFKLDFGLNFGLRFEHFQQVFIVGSRLNVDGKLFV